MTTPLLIRILIITQQRYILSIPKYIFMDYNSKNNAVKSGIKLSFYRFFDLELKQV